MIVVADASPLRYLILSEYAHVLRALYGTLTVPPIVITELSKPRHAILRNRLGASRVRFAADAPLTRPARSRWTGNYRSDGGIGSIPIRLTISRVNTVSNLQSVDARPQT